jgi:serine/threonine protein kinase
MAAHQHNTPYVLTRSDEFRVPQALTETTAFMPEEPRTESKGDPQLEYRTRPQQIGPYEILTELGIGGMGTVYKARDAHSGGIVALKTPRTEIAASPDLLRRFQREALAVQCLSHENICHIVAFGSDRHIPFLAMSFIDGQPLSQRIDPRQPIEPQQAVEWVLGLARALAYAHERGIVHRDLKPANIIVSTDGRPVITDFGLARRLDVATDVRVTQTGTMLGTPAYMAPEQVDGDTTVDARLGDIYSLGVILYEMLTGRLPFAGSLGNVLVEITTTEPILPTEINPNIEQRLEDICLKMMARDPAQRYASMRQLADALEVYRAGPASAAIERKAWQIRSRSLQAAQDCMERNDFDQAVAILKELPDSLKDTHVRAGIATAKHYAQERRDLARTIAMADSDTFDVTLKAPAARLLELDPEHQRAIRLQERLAALEQKWALLRHALIGALILGSASGAIFALSALFGL